MKEELKNLIDNEYDRIEVEDTSSDYLENINKQIEEQNIKVAEAELDKSTVVKDFLKKHNKENFNELTQEEINELIKDIDEELKNLE